MNLLSILGAAMLLAGFVLLVVGSNALDDAKGEKAEGEKLVRDALAIRAGWEADRTKRCVECLAKMAHERRARSVRDSGELC